MCVCVCSSFLYLLFTVTSHCTVWRCCAINWSNQIKPLTQLSQDSLVAWSTQGGGLLKSKERVMKDYLLITVNCLGNLGNPQVTISFISANTSEDQQQPVWVTTPDTAATAQLTPQDSGGSLWWSWRRWSTKPALCLHHRRSAYPDTSWRHWEAAADQEERRVLLLLSEKKKNFGLWLGRERKIVDVKYCMRSSGNKWMQQIKN